MHFRGSITPENRQREGVGTQISVTVTPVCVMSPGNHISPEQFLDGRSGPVTNRPEGHGVDASSH